MRYTLLALLLVGCSVVPVQRDFPEAPAELQKSCPDLKQTPKTEKLSEVIDIVVDNYSTYHECQELNMRWNEWYTKQREIFNNIN